MSLDVLMSQIYILFNLCLSGVSLLQTVQPNAAVKCHQLFATAINYLLVHFPVLPYLCLSLCTYSEKKQSKSLLYSNTIRPEQTQFPATIRFSRTRILIKANPCSGIYLRIEVPHMVGKFNEILDSHKITDLRIDTQ